MCLVSILPLRTSVSASVSSVGLSCPSMCVRVIPSKEQKHTAMACPKCAITEELP